MFNKITVGLSLGIILIFVLPAKACDGCGGGIAGSYMGIIPNFSNNLIGVRHQSQRFDHTFRSSTSNGNARQLESDFMYRTDLWLRIYPSKRWQFLAFVPYQVHLRQETKESFSIEGIGDLRLRTFYSVVNSGDSISGNWRHTLLVGGEVKLPTGKYKQVDPLSGRPLPEIFQIGTGGYGLSPSIMYTVRKKAWGIVSDFQYTYNTMNEERYRWGEQFASSMKLFYWKNSNNGQHTLLPSLGYSFEYFAPDTDTFFSNMKIKQNGGQMSFLFMGLDYYSDRWMMQLFAQIPLQYNLAEEVPEGQWRLGMTLGLFF
jgi:hypothetical protein